MPPQPLYGSPSTALPTSIPAEVVITSSLFIVTSSTSHGKNCFAVLLFNFLTSRKFYFSRKIFRVFAFSVKLYAFAPFAQKPPFKGGIFREDIIRFFNVCLNFNANCRFSNANCKIFPFFTLKRERTEQKSRPFFHILRAKHSGGECDVYFKNPVVGGNIHFSAVLFYCRFNAS